MALALKVPVFFVVTKVDICPEHVLKHTLATLQAILKKPGVKKKPFMVRLCTTAIELIKQNLCAYPMKALTTAEELCPLPHWVCDSRVDVVLVSAQVRNKDDVLTCARHMHTDSLAPVFLTSSVTGEGLELVRLFYNLLPQRHKW